MFTPAWLALRWWREVCPVVKRDALVFASTTGTKLNAGNWGGREFRPATALAGMARCANERCGVPVPATEEASDALAVSTTGAWDNVARWEQRMADHRRDPLKHRKPSGPRPREPWQCAECKGYNVTGPEFHELRHTFGTLAYYATKDLKQVAEWMVHSDTRMLERRYKKRLLEREAEAVRAANAVFAAASG
jgi:hypothetical protein